MSTKRVFAVYKCGDHDAPVQLSRIRGTKPDVISYVLAKLGEFKPEYLRRTKHGYVYERLGVATYHFTSEFEA